jgi:ubiquinone/menaquinone biosynthesis C-methylase UbiE
MVNPATNQHNEMVNYWDQGFTASEKDPKAFYDLGRLPLILQESHYRRMELLDSLPIGDISDKVCVDYGVGPWGFGAVYQRLRNCHYAIGIDISEKAIQLSHKISDEGDFPYGKNFRYFTSLGNQLELDDASVDIFFAGEAIEHVDDVAAFLDEVYRILKPEGLVILTTPNADAYLYKMHNERYTFNAEHVSLMNYSELCVYLSRGFELLTSKGFNGSFYRTYDGLITEPLLIKDWARAFENQPEFATGLVVMARKKADYQPSHYVHQYYHHTSPDIHYEGDWENCSLHGPLSGLRGYPDKGSRLSLGFEGDGLIINFWGHDWSVFADIELDGERKKINLYSPHGAFHNIRFSNLKPGQHKIIISTTAEKDSFSVDYQLIFWRMISVTSTRPLSNYSEPKYLPNFIGGEQNPPTQKDNQLTQERMELLQEQLRQLSGIETTRTWRLASRLSYSRAGRLMSRLLKPWL